MWSRKPLGVPKTLPENPQGGIIFIILRIMAIFKALILSMYIHFHEAAMTYEDFIIPTANETCACMLLWF